ncbi:toxin glutamine deamidase domain-containing protein [Kitasatospora gansuensis]|nr:toxin glutamine deamidase domain-containing protein [Kitasatospora gansuensis]
MLPDSVEWVLEMLGFDWPKADEDKLMESAQVWRDFADTVDELHYRAAGAANNVRSANSGDSIEAFGKAWEKFSAGGSDGYLADAATASRLIAAAFDAAAMIVIACKIAVIAQLVVLAVEIIAAQAAAPFTLGLSELGAAGAVQATKMIVRRLLKELRDALVEAILETLKEPVVSAVQAMISDLIAQTVNQGFGAQDGYDLGRTGKAGAEEFVTAVKNSGQTFTEALRDGVGSRAGGHARGGLDSAAGHGNNADSSGSNHGSDASNSNDSSSRSNDSSPSSSSNPSSSSSPSGNSPSSASPSGSSPSSSSPSGSSPSSSSPSSSSTTPDSTPSRDTSPGSDGPRSTQQSPSPTANDRGSTPLDPFGTRVGPEANTPQGDAGSTRPPAGDSSTPSRSDDNGRTNTPSPEPRSTPDSNGPSRTPDGDPGTRPNSGPSEAGPTRTPDGDSGTRPNSSSPDGPSRTPDHEPGSRPAATDGPSRTPDSGDSRPHPGPSESAHPTRTPDHDPGSRPAPAESTSPARADDSRPSYGPVRPAEPTPSHQPAPADIPAPRHESTPAQTRPDAAPQPVATTPDARTPVHSTTPDHATPEAPSSRVDPRTAFADPAGATTSDGSGTSAPRLNTAGLGATATAPPSAGPDHRPTPQPTPDTPTPAATPGGVPGGVPHTANPTASNPTTPGANRPTAPSTPATAPTVQPQRRPDRDGPTFTPRPAADRGPATNRPDPRTTYANPRPDIPSRLDPTGSNNSRPDATRPDGTRPDLGSRLDPTGSSTARPDAKRPDSTRPDVGSRLDPTGSNATRPDSTRPDGTRPDLGSRLDPTGSNSTRPDTTRPDGTRPDIPSRLDPTGSNNTRPDTARPDSTSPDIGSRLDPTGQDSARPDDATAKEPHRPATADRPAGSPGGILDPTERDHQRVNDATPHNPDGTPVRHPDPNEGNWPGAINGDDPNAPGRNNNCVDTALATVDTFDGNPTPAGARTPDHDANGNPSDRGERNGRDRIENALGAKFNDMGDGPAAYRRLEDTLRQNGHGSQAVIITTDADGRSHAWNAVNHNGAITYIDSQTGQRSDKPLHNGDNGVFAIPLDPDRNPTEPTPHADPDHNSDNDRRAPEEPAGNDGDGRYSDEAERQRVRKQVEKANKEPEWFKEHYNREGDRRRIGKKDENGNEIPQLRQNPDYPADSTRWIAAQDAPPPAAESYKDGAEVERASAVPADRERSQRIEEAAEKRDAALARDKAAEKDLEEAKNKHEQDKTDEAAKAEYERLRQDHKEPHHLMGKAGEELGDRVAEFHAVPENFPGAERIDDRKDGNNRFDQIWQREDGGFVVVEAKAPSADLGDRKALNGRQVMQGHPDYFEAILAQMKDRKGDDGTEAALARKLRAAWKAGKLDYVMVKAKVDGQNGYDGYLMKQFDIGTPGGEGNTSAGDSGTP